MLTATTSKSNQKHRQCVAGICPCSNVIRIQIYRWPCPRSRGSLPYSLCRQDIDPKLPSPLRFSIRLLIPVPAAFHIITVSGHGCCASPRVLPCSSGTLCPLHAACIHPHLHI